jgi:flagellar hook-basal body protein
MSFYTALTGLAAATASLGVTSNNIANVGTTGFKRSRADFGDIFATSPLQKASSVIGQGVALKQVTQEFSQGNIQFSANALDLAITGDGFFPLKSADGLQDIYTRNGTFLLDDSFAVVNSAGQFLQAASVDSSGKADLDTLRKLLIPRSTAGDARETTLIDLALNLPADGQVITVPFDRNDPSTYNLTTAVTVFDAGGNEFLATVYYQKTKRATPDDPANKWQTHVFIGDTKLNELLIQATDDTGEELYVNKYGEVRSENGSPPIPPQDIARGVTKLYNIDDLRDRQQSVPAVASGDPLAESLIAQWKNGFNIRSQLSAMLGETPIDGITEQSPLKFSLNVDDSRDPIIVDLSYLNEPGADLTRTYTGVEIARELTNAINKAYGDERFFDFTSLKATESSTSVDLFNITVAGIDATPVAEDTFTVSLSEVRANASPLFGSFTELSEVRTEDAVDAIQAQINEKAYTEGLKGAYKLAVADHYNALSVAVQNVTSNADLRTAFETQLENLRDADENAKSIAGLHKDLERSEMQKIVFPDPSNAGVVTVGGADGVAVSISLTDTAKEVATKVKTALDAVRFGAKPAIETVAFTAPTAGASGTIRVGGIEVDIDETTESTAELVTAKVLEALEADESYFLGEKQEIEIPLSFATSGAVTLNVTDGDGDEQPVVISPAGAASALAIAKGFVTAIQTATGFENHRAAVSKQTLEVRSSLTSVKTPTPDPAGTAVTDMKVNLTYDVMNQTTSPPTVISTQSLSIPVPDVKVGDSAAEVAYKAFQALKAGQSVTPATVPGELKFRLVGSKLSVEYPDNAVPNTLALAFTGTNNTITQGNTATMVVEFPRGAGDVPLMSFENGATPPAPVTALIPSTVRELDARTIFNNGNGSLSFGYVVDDETPGHSFDAVSPIAFVQEGDTSAAVGVSAVLLADASRLYAQRTIANNFDGSLIVTYSLEDGDTGRLSVTTGTVLSEVNVSTIREFQRTQTEQQRLEFTAPTLDAIPQGETLSIFVAGIEVKLSAADDTAEEVAAKVTQALVSSPFITQNPGRFVTNNLDGSVTIQYSLDDKDVGDATFSSSVPGVRLAAFATTQQYFSTAIPDDLTEKEAARAVAQAIAPLQIAAKVAIDAKLPKAEILRAVEQMAARQDVSNPYFDLVTTALTAARSEAARSSSTALSVYEAVLGSANGSQRAAVEAYSSRAATRDTVFQAIENAQAAALTETNLLKEQMEDLTDPNNNPQVGVSVVKDTISTAAEARTFTANVAIARADAFRAVEVGYDPVNGSFSFNSASDDQVRLSSASIGRNQLFGLELVPTTVDRETGLYGSTFFPNGNEILGRSEQRYGIRVSFDDNLNVFNVSSGTTGDTSSVKISDASAVANLLFGFSILPADEVQAAPTGPTPVVEQSRVPQRGIESMPAVLKGNTIGINIENKFAVDARNDTFVVTIDNVTSLIQMPRKSDYNIEEFRQQFEQRINSMADSFGRTTNGVRVEIKTNEVTNTRFFEITSGTQGDNAFIKVSGPSIWGLSDLESVRGATTRWIEPIQAADADGFPLYVDRDGKETTDASDFSEDETRDLWIPVFLDKGELTFDTAGKIVSPLSAINFRPETIGTSGSTLGIAIDYAGSTQFSSPFSILAQAQNGRPEGDLIGLDIGDDGLVSANYSNGSQKNLAKVVLANFANPTGLRQIGDASFYANSKSGSVTLGEAGTAGYGTVRAGARERANVDLTTELIELITNQRNFQANAKAIETNNTLTQAIINIR